MISDHIFSLAYKEYTEQFANIKDTRILQDFNQEVGIQEEYRGREIYELIQNADDQSADKMVIILDTTPQKKTLTVKNTGNKPFTEEGFKSIMRANVSSKQLFKQIGQKGLGFRSVLNWAEELEIHSAGVNCRFSAEIADKKWKAIQDHYREKVAPDEKPYLENDFDEMTRIAKARMRQSPIAILAVPNYEHYTEPDGDYAASIRLTLKNKEVQDRIIDQLKSLEDGRALLFLPHLKTLQIIVNGKETLVQKIDLHNDRVTIQQRMGDEVRKNEWFLSGEMKDGYYEVAVAFPLDGKVIPDRNTLYCFFPTKETNPYNCVVHATFRLGQSRNHLIEDPENERLILKCAERMLDVAETDFDLNDRWAKFKVVYTEHSVNGLYQEKLEKALLNKLLDRKVFPAVDGIGYLSGKDVHFVSSALSDVVQNVLGGSNCCFSDMLSALPGEHFLDKLRINDEWTYKETDLVDQLSGLSDFISMQGIPMERRARLIKAVIEGVPGGFGAGKPTLLIDDKMNVIRKKGYLISREEPPEIPSFIDIRYVHKDLYEELCSELDIKKNDENVSGRPRERMLWERLEKHLDVSYADKNTIVKLIAPSSPSDEGIPERVRSLFEFYAKDVEKNDIVLTDTSVWLLNASDVPMESSKLVFHGDDLDEKWHLLDAEKWGFTEIDPKKLNSFWKKLHVSEFIPMVRFDVMKDVSYLDRIELTGSSGGDKRANYTKEQFVFVPDPDFVKEYGKSHSLRSFLKLTLQETSLFNSIMSNQRLQYSYYGDQHREFSLSYPAYYMQRLDILKDLQGYVCGEGSLHSADVLSYEEACLVRSDISRSEYNVFLGKLGAVDALSDLPAPRLYDLLNDIAVRFPDGKGVPQRYEKLKAALAIRSKSEKLRIPDELMLLARDSSGMVEAHKYSEVYYWDNDRFPKSMVSGIPKLLMNSRAGEETIAAVFGVKRLIPMEESVVIAGDSKRNIPLEDELRSYLLERKQVFSQIRNVDVKDPVARNKMNRYLYDLIENGGIRCYEYCVFEKDGKQCALGENEMVPSQEEGRIFYNVTHKGEFDIHNPRFCESILDIFSLKFGLRADGSEIIDDFRRVLLYTKSEIEFHFNDLPDAMDEMPAVLVAHAADSPDFDVLNYRKRHEIGFMNALWEYLSKHSDRQGEFVGLCIKYKENDWLKLVNSDPDRIRIDFNEKVSQFLGLEQVLDIREDATLRKPMLDEYEREYPDIKTIERKLGETTEDNELKSYLFFPGNEKRIKTLIDKYLQTSVTSTKPPVSYDISQYSLKTTVWKKRKEEENSGQDDKNSPEHNQTHGQNHIRVQLLDDRADEIGAMTEKIALELIEKKGFAEIVSSNNPVGGTNMKHYDIQYLKETEDGKKTLRFLEVKSMQQGSCELTAAEYAFGMENAEVYDIAFLVGKTLYLYESPFLEAEVRHKLFKPTGFRILAKDLDLS